MNKHILLQLAVALFLLSGFATCQVVETSVTVLNAPPTVDSLSALTPAVLARDQTVVWCRGIVTDRNGRHAITEINSVLSNPEIQIPQKASTLLDYPEDYLNISKKAYAVFLVDKEGDFTCKLTVTDNKGASNSNTTEVRVCAPGSRDCPKQQALSLAAPRFVLKGGEVGVSGSPADILYVVSSPTGEYMIMEADSAGGTVFSADSAGSWRVYAVKQGFTQASADIFSVDPLWIASLIVLTAILSILRFKKRKTSKTVGEGGS